MMSLNYQMVFIPYWDIQDYIEYIIRQHDTLARISHIYVYINIINNRLAFNYKRLKH